MNRLVRLWRCIWTKHVLRPSLGRGRHNLTLMSCSSRKRICISVGGMRSDSSPGKCQVSRWESEGRTHRNGTAVKARCTMEIAVMEAVRCPINSHERYAVQSFSAVHLDSNRSCLRYCCFVEGCTWLDLVVQHLHYHEQRLSFREGSMSTTNFR